MSSFPSRAQSQDFLSLNRVREWTGKLLIPQAGEVETGGWQQFSKQLRHVFDL